jgi:hypothetical protein
MYLHDADSVSGLCNSVCLVFAEMVSLKDESFFIRTGITDIAIEHVWSHENRHAI